MQHADYQQADSESRGYRVECTLSLVGVSRQQFYDQNVLNAFKDVMCWQCMKYDVTPADIVIVRFNESVYVVEFFIVASSEDHADGIADAIHDSVSSVLASRLNEEWEEFGVAVSQTTAVIQVVEMMMVTHQQQQQQQQGQYQGVESGGGDVVMQQQQQQLGDQLDVDQLQPADGSGRPMSYIPGALLTSVQSQASRIAKLFHQRDIYKPFEIPLGESQGSQHGSGDDDNSNATDTETNHQQQQQQQQQQQSAQPVQQPKIVLDNTIEEAMKAINSMGDKNTKNFRKRLDKVDKQGTDELLRIESQRSSLEQKLAGSSSELGVRQDKVKSQRSRKNFLAQQVALQMQLIDSLRTRLIFFEAASDDLWSSLKNNVYQYVTPSPSSRIIGSRATDTRRYTSEVFLWVVSQDQLKPNSQIVSAQLTSTLFHYTFCIKINLHQRQNKQQQLQQLQQLQQPQLTAAQIVQQATNSTSTTTTTTTTPTATATPTTNTTATATEEPDIGADATAGTPSVQVKVRLGKRRDERQRGKKEKQPTAAANPTADNAVSGEDANDDGASSADAVATGATTNDDSQDKVCENQSGDVVAEETVQQQQLQQQTGDEDTTLTTTTTTTTTTTNIPSVTDTTNDINTNTNNNVNDAKTIQDVEPSSTNTQQQQQQQQQDEEDIWIGCGVVLRMGEADHLAKWPFALRCEISIVDSQGNAVATSTLNAKNESQSTIQRAFLQPSPSNNVAWGCGKLVNWKSISQNLLQLNDFVQFQLRFTE